MINAWLAWLNVSYIECIIHVIHVVSCYHIVSSILITHQNPILLFWLNCTLELRPKKLGVVPLWWGVPRTLPAYECLHDMHPAITHKISLDSWITLRVKICQDPFWDIHPYLSWIVHKSNVFEHCNDISPMWFSWPWQLASWPFFLRRPRQLHWMKKGFLRCEHLATLRNLVDLDDARPVVVVSFRNDTTGRDESRSDGIWYDLYDTQ